MKHLIVLEARAGHRYLRKINDLTKSPTKRFSNIVQYVSSPTTGKAMKLIRKSQTKTIKKIFTTPTVQNMLCLTALRMAVRHGNT